MALTREQFDKLRASGLTTEQIINFERGYVPPKKEESFLGGLGRDIASPFVRGAELVSSAASLTGSSAKALYQSKTGQQEQAKQTMSEALKKAQDRTTTKVNVFGREEAPITNTRQAIGAGLEVGSNLIGGGGAKNVFQSGLKAGFKTLAKEGAKTGLASGLTYGLGTGLQGEGNFGQVAKETALGGVTGLVGGAVLAPAIGAGEKGLFKLTDYGIKSVKNVASAVNKKIKGVVTADDIERELLNIETGYQKTRKMMNFSKDAGSETRKRLISADVLSDVTDDAGIMRTKTPGGAKDQYKAKTIDGSEGLVKETLVKEGRSVSPEALRGKMINDIMNSGLEGRALKTALNNIDGEIEGLLVRATPDGQIPLSVIHDAKISTTNSIDFNTEAFVKAERKANAGSYKRIIEETSDEPIEAINKELQKDYKVLELLDVLDGKRVKGGKLGKYFSQIGGNIVGGAVGSVGGPFGSAVGTILGGEVAGKIKGQMLKNTFGKSIGSTIEKSGILVEASNKVKAPRLLLPAPKPGSPRSSMGSGPTINLPSKTQSTLDKNYSYNLGKRNTMYNTPKTTTNTTIKLKSNNNTPSLSNKKTSVKLKSAEDVSKKLDSLNPTGSVFAKYTPKQRATAELADNITTLDKTMGKSADEMITVYRGSSKGSDIVPGDFITTNKQLAKDYAGNGKILEKKVKLSDILDDTTEPLGEEYIYRPKTNLKSSKDTTNPLNFKTAEDYVKARPVVYHGTPEKFDNFSLEQVGKSTDSGMFGKGIYFTDDLKEATTYSKRGDKVGEVKEVILDLKKPYIIKTKNDIPKIDVPMDTIEQMKVADKEYSRLFTEKLQKQGYDGVIDMMSPGSKQYVVFNPKQIKTKSQLISEWNKAQKSNPLIQEAKKIEPLYHGTTNKFSSFDVNKMTTGNTGKGIYLTSDKNAGKYYGKLSAEELALKNSKDLEVPKIKEPVVMEITLSNDAKIKKFNKFPTDKEVELAKKDGFDGISYPDEIIKNTQGIPYLPKNANTIMMFKPDKIKIKK